MSDDSLSDDELEQRLRAALRDPVPEEVLRVSEDLFTWRTIDAELAELETTDSTAMAGVRGANSTVITFVVDDRVVEVEVDEDRTVVVDLGGRWAAGIDLVARSGITVEGAIDEAGVCRFVAAPTGPVQLVITKQDGALVKLRWITL